MGKLSRKFAKKRNSLWETRFQKSDDHSLGSEKGNYYNAKIFEGKYQIKLLKKNFFVWITEKKYIASSQDFRIVISFSFDRNNGYSAAGCVVSYLDDKNFYYLLLSSRGFLRFDVVVNGSPKKLLGWTPCAALVSSDAG